MHVHPLRLNPPTPPHPTPPCRSVRLEQQIESEYRGALQQQCYNERMLQVCYNKRMGPGECWGGLLALAGTPHTAGTAWAAIVGSFGLLISACPPSMLPHLSAATVSLLWAEGGGEAHGAQVVRRAHPPLWQPVCHVGGRRRRRRGARRLALPLKRAARERIASWQRTWPLFLGHAQPALCPAPTPGCPVHSDPASCWLSPVPSLRFPGTCHVLDRSTGRIPGEGQTVWAASLEATCCTPCSRGFIPAARSCRQRIDSACHGVSAAQAPGQLIRLL